MLERGGEPWYSEGMRFPLIPALMLFVVVSMATGSGQWIVSAFGLFTAWSVWLSARREEEAEALIAELRRQAEARGFALPASESLPALVARHRALKRGKRGSGRPAPDGYTH